MRQVIEEVVRRNMEGKEYDNVEAKKQAEQICVEIRTQAKNLSVPSYKIIV